MRLNCRDGLFGGYENEKLIKVGVNELMKWLSMLMNTFMSVYLHKCIIVYFICVCLTEYVRKR